MTTTETFVLTMLRTRFWGEDGPPPVTERNQRYGVSVAVDRAMLASEGEDAVLRAFYDVLPRVGVVPTNLISEEDFASDLWRFSLTYCIVRVRQEKIEVTMMGSSFPQYVNGIKYVEDIPPVVATSKITVDAEGLAREVLRSDAMRFNFGYGISYGPGLAWTGVGFQPDAPEPPARRAGEVVDLHPKRAMTFKEEDL